MHFTNTIFSSNNNKDQQIKSSVVFGNMILESTRKAELTADVKSFLDEAKKANAAKDSAKVTQIFDTVKNNYPTQYAEFISEYGNPVSNNSGKKDEEKKNNPPAPRTPPTPPANEPAPKPPVNEPTPPANNPTPPVNEPPAPPANDPAPTPPVKKKQGFVMGIGFIDED